MQLKIASVARFHCDVDDTISCEDNLKFMRRLPNESMKLIATSPPYNIGKEYEEKRSQDRYIEEQVACVAEAVRLLHSNRSICWQVGNHVQDGEIFPLDIILYPIFKKRRTPAPQPHRLDIRPRAALPKALFRSPRDYPLVHEDGKLHVQP